MSKDEIKRLAELSAEEKRIEERIRKAVEESLRQQFALNRNRRQPVGRTR